jgi:hypothetical protein
LKSQRNEREPSKRLKEEKQENNNMDNINCTEFEAINDEDLENASGGRRRRFGIVAPGYGYPAAYPTAYPTYAAPTVPQVMPSYGYAAATPVASPYGFAAPTYGGYGMRLGTAI